MSWRNYYSAPPSPAVNKAAITLKEPGWVAVLPGAKGLWSMIVTFRQRGSNDIANNLESAAEKQAEALLRTQNLMNKPTCDQRSANIKVPERKNQRNRIRSRTPTPECSDNNTKKSNSLIVEASRDSYSELDGDIVLEHEKPDEALIVCHQSRSQNPSGAFRYVCFPQSLTFSLCLSQKLCRSIDHVRILTCLLDAGLTH